MKYCFSLLYILLLSLSSFAQNEKIEQWENALTDITSDTQQVMLLQKLAWEWKDADLTKADEYADKAIYLAEEIGFIHGQAKSYKTKGVLHWYKGEMDEAIQTFHTALDKFEVVGDKKGQANIYNNLGLAQQMGGDYSQAIDYLSQAYKIRTEINDLEGIATSCNNLGVIYQMLGAYDYSLNNHLRALEIYEFSNNDKNKVRSLLNIGNIYAIMEDHEKARLHFEQALDLLNGGDDKRGLADVYSNLGENSFSLKAFEEALGFFQKSLDLRTELEDPVGMRESLTDLGKVLDLQGKGGKARAAHEQALQLANEIEDPRSQLIALLFLGEHLKKGEKLDLARDHLEEALQIAKEIGSKAEAAKTHRLLAEYFEDKGDTKSALQNQIAYADIRDDIFDEEKAQSLRRMQIVYETEKKETQILALEEDYSEAVFEKYSLLVLMVIILLFGVSWFLFYRFRSEAKNSKLLYEKNREIEFHNQQLAISNADLEQYAYVVSHDLKQPLRTIGSFAGLLERRYKESLDTEGKEYIDFITKGAKQMHQLLTDLLNYSRLDTSDRMEELNLNDALNLSIENLREQIEKTKAIIISDELPRITGNMGSQVLLFQNLLSNAMTYSGGKRPEIEITYQDQGDSHLISFQDNGIGIEEAYMDKIFTVFQQLQGRDEYGGTGIGLSICQKVVLRHNGKIWLESRKGEGSTFFVNLPKQRVPLAFS
ncbi:MAG: tetratricopeptide repeat protein [Bacteroidia bacterium]|nr:tetratricopeptide repeat protein [Bacteroidia bacterium]